MSQTQELKEDTSFGAAVAQLDGGNGDRLWEQEGGPFKTNLDQLALDGKW